MVEKAQETPRNCWAAVRLEFRPEGVLCAADAWLGE
jgi:hypothetical protein